MEAARTNRRTIQRLGVLCGLLASALSAAPASAELVDAVIATVGKDVILYSEIVAVIGSELDSLRTTATSQSDYDQQAEALVEVALEEAIESRILLREARKFSVEIGDDEVEERIDSLRTQFENDDQFMAELAAVGESLSDFRERTREQIMSQRFAYSKLKSLEDEVVVSDQEIQEYYNANADLFNRPEQIYVRQIHLRAPRDSEARDQARIRLQSLRAEILSGADFNELAKEHSQSPGADQGGIIGWQQRGDLRAELEEAAFPLAAGEVSPVVDTQFGVHILRVDERREAKTAPLEEVRLDIEPIVRARGAEDRYRTWLADLRKRSRVRIFL